MLWLIVALLVVFWVLGWAFHIAGYFIHGILAIAAALAVANFLLGRRSA